MTNLGRSYSHFLRRHAEALFIIAFLLADCFLSGWALTAGTVVAILYVLAPAIQSIPKLSAAGRITYLKAFVKTANVQRLAILLFWIYSIRFLLSAITDSRLFVMENEPSPTFFSVLIVGAQQFAPFAFLASPIFIYSGACFIAILLRSRLKASKEDPDLIGQRQRWAGTSQFLFLAAYITSILSITLNPKGPGYLLSNWLLASAKDANIWKDLRSPQISAPSTGYWVASAPSLPPADATGVFSNLSFLQPFDTFILTAVSAVAMLLLLKPALRFTAFLTSFCWRVVSA